MTVRHNDESDALIGDRPVAAANMGRSRAFLARSGTLICVAASLLALVMSLDPAGEGWGMDTIPVLRYSPIELSVAAMPFLLATKSRWPHKLLVLLLIVLDAMMLVGSIITIRQGHSLEESMTGRAVGVFSFFAAYLLFRDEKEGAFYISAVRLPLLIIGILISLLTALWQAGAYSLDVPNVYHEEVFIVAAGAFVAFVTIRDFTLRIALFLVLLAGALLTIKNTGFLAAAIVCGLVAVLAWSRTASAGRFGRIFTRYLLLGSTLTAIAGAVIVVVFFRNLLPSGSPGVRMHTYLIRIAQFVEHPIGGSWWVGTPLILLTGRHSTYFPTHSDVLDILAFGGIISAMLFSIPCVGALIAVLRRTRERSRLRDGNWALQTAVLCTFLIEMTFNPVWGQPRLVLFLWYAVAYGLTRPPVHTAKLPRTQSPPWPSRIP